MSLINKSFSILFPGQGAQSQGMGQELSSNYPEANEVFQQANDILGISLSEICWGNPDNSLNDTYNTQPALLTHSIAAWKVFQNNFPNLSPMYAAGHSLGQFSALVVAGALSFEDGLNLVRIRGRLMKEAGVISPGGMAAVLGLDIPTVENICTEANNGDEKVQVANDNCPGQIVVSGNQNAVDRFMVLAKDSGARKIVPLVVSVAAHSYLMDHAQVEFNQAVEEANFNTPNIPVIGNVSATPLNNISEIKTDIKSQLTNRVRWTESMQFLQEKGTEAILELGSGSVLSGLMKRIDRKISRYNLANPTDLISFSE